MSKNILQQLFDGEVYPAEDIIGNRKLSKRLAEEKAAFIKSLSEHDREMFQKVDDLNDESANIYGYECFAHGFKLGATLLFEALRDSITPAQNKDN